MHQNCEHSTGLRTRTGSNSLLNRTDRQCVCTVSYGKPEGTFIFKVHDLLCFRASIIWKTDYYSVKICCLDAYSFCSDCIYTFLWNVFILRTFMFLVINCDQVINLTSSILRSGKMNMAGVKTKCRKLTYYACFP